MDRISKQTANAAYLAWALLSCAVHILLFRGKVNIALAVWQRLLLVPIAILAVLFVHEGVHFVFMKLFGLGKVKLIFARDKLGIPTPGVLAQKQGTKRQEIIMRLAPFALLTLLPDILFAFFSGVHLLFFLMAMANCAGCFYDLLDVRRLLKAERG